MKTLMAFFLAFIFCMTFCNGFCQTIKGEEDLIIDVQDRIEYDKQKNICTGYGHVHAKKGSIELDGDLVKIHFQEDADAQKKIAVIEVFGHAVFKNEKATLKAPYLHYTVKNQTLKAKGPDISLDTTEDLLLAEDFMDYSQESHLAHASGDIVFTHKKQGETPYVVKANQAKAIFFPEDQEKKKPKTADISDAHLKIKSLVAKGNVIFIQEEKISHADHARYDGILEKLYLTGHVRLAQEDHFGMGDRAIVDLKNKKSQLSSSQKKVRFLLNPKAVSKNEKKS